MVRLQWRVGFVCQSESCASLHRHQLGCIRCWSYMDVFGMFTTVKSRDALLNTRSSFRITVSSANGQRLAFAQALFPVLSQSHQHQVLSALVSCPFFSSFESFSHCSFISCCC